jgi:hypothetical protein
MTKTGVVRQSVDLSLYPDLIVIVLGFRVRNLRGLSSLIRLDRGLKRIRRSPPDGLLADERMYFSPMHIALRQYWRDFESLEHFTRHDPHSTWWQTFLKDSGGAGFWHEVYSARLGIEAVYVDMPETVGLGRFAPLRSPTGSFLTSRGRLDAFRGQARAGEPAK